LRTAVGFYADELHRQTVRQNLDTV
jgi:hypothetical protein